MIEVNKDSLEARILKLLLREYPVTLTEIGGRLRVKEGVLRNSIRVLEINGVVGLEYLPDKVFVRLLREDFCFTGLRPVQKKGIVKKTRKKRVKEYNGMMYR